MEARKLVSVSVFYRNNTTTGYGCSMSPDMYQAIDDQCEQVWQEFRNECPSDEAIAELLFDQLNAMVSVKPLTQAQQCLAIMNILMLVDHGFLTNDEFNGVQFCYAPAAVADLMITAIFV